MRLLIKNAELFDGINTKSRTASILIDGDKIIDVMDIEPKGYEGETLDVSGLCVAPGFIDTHSHNDFYCVVPEAVGYNRSFIRQGITSVIGGQCGFSMVGIDPETEYNNELFAFFHKNSDYKRVCNFAGFKSAVDEYSPLNVACFAGHGTLRTSIRGLGQGELTASEMEELEYRVDTALSEGAAGLSYGLMYDPSMFGSYDELVRLAKVAAKHDKPISFHTRAMSKVSMSYPELLGRAHNLRALDEAIKIARESGARAHISHIIFVGTKTWPTLNETIAIIDKANASGLDISFDIYPFDFGASTINVALPSWYQGMTEKEKSSIFKQLRLRAEITAARMLLGFGFSDIELTWAGEDHKDYIGKRVSEIAKESGMSDLSAYLNIVEECGSESTVIMYKYMNEHIINTLSRHDKVHYMTDAWIVDEGMQNPAAFSSFPKFLRLSREGKAEELGAMIVKMTGGAAQRFKLCGRGRIETGAFADIVVFDKQSVRESEGEQAPIGIPHVIINGEFAVKNGEYIPGSFGRGIGVE